MKNLVGSILVFASCCAFYVAADHPGHGNPTFCTSNKADCMMSDLNITCVEAKSGSSCAKEVADGNADLALAVADDIVKNAENLKIVVGEKLTGLENFVRYYGLAVVKKNTTFTFKQLKGQKSCHTGVGKTVGWKIPVGYLLLKKIMDFTDSQYKSASDFFGQSCAPGIGNIAGVSDAVKDDLCSLCNGTGNNKCTKTDPYYDYEGAFKCMADGNNDRVGFVKETTAAAVLKKYPQYGDESDYRLLCTDGMVKDLKDFKTCNIEKRPASAVVTHKDKTNAMVEMYANMLKGGDIAKLRKAHIVNNDTESLQDYSGPAKDYVGEYGELYNALAGPSGASAIAFSVALQIASIFALLSFF